MLANKLVIRRLPPSLTEEDFLKHISPLPKHDYFCYFEASSGLGQHSFSRAYINIVDSEDMSVFRERFDNYVFLDKDGHEYPAVVEQSLWDKTANNGPWYCASNQDKKSDESKEPNLSTATEDNIDSIEQDPEFIEFIGKFKSKISKNCSRTPP